jgi:hypothetical protein
MTVRFATKTRIFSPPNSKVETAFGAHSSSYSIGVRESIPGNKVVTRNVDHSPPSTASFKNAYRYTYLYSSPNTVRVIKSRMRWAGNVARMGERRGVYRVSVGKPEGKRPLGRPGVDGRIILR